MIAETFHYVTFDGIDASGKSTLLQMLAEQYNVKQIQAPPKYLGGFRKNADNSDLRLRFLFYVMGNVLSDRQEIRKLMQIDGDGVLLQDRSWLTTLTAHELRGLSSFWLQFGKCIAKTCQKPDRALILHVDEDERLKRLTKRGLITKSDKENVNFADQMEAHYKRWSENLDWQVLTFDNTYFEPEGAAQAIAAKLNLRKRQ